MLVLQSLASCNVNNCAELNKFNGWRNSAACQQVESKLKSDKTSVLKVIRKIVYAMHLKLQPKSISQHEKFNRNNVNLFQTRYNPSHC